MLLFLPIILFSKFYLLFLLTLPIILNKNPNFFTKLMYCNIEKEGEIKAHCYETLLFHQWMKKRDLSSHVKGGSGEYSTTFLYL